MEPLPKQMRGRTVALCGRGVPTKRIADGLGTSRSGTRRIRQNLRERGTLDPVRATTGYAGGLTPEVGRRLRALVAAGPGATRHAPRDRLGVSVGVRAVGRWPSKPGLVLKKKSLRAAEQDRPGVGAAREAWHGSLASAPPERLVFVDASGARTDMTRPYGRAGPAYASSPPCRTGAGRRAPCRRPSVRPARRRR